MKKENFVKTLMLVLMAILFIVPSLAGAAEQTKKKEPVSAEAKNVATLAEERFENFICYNNYFTAKIPAGWNKYEDILDGEATREYGVDLQGPQNKDGAYTSITVIYYLPDHVMFQTVEKFIEVNANPNDYMNRHGETVTPVKEIPLAGTSASTFDRKTFLFIPPYAVKPNKIPMFERLIVLKAKEGFYVLKFSSPEDSYPNYLGTFEKVVKSFKPNRH